MIRALRLLTAYIHAFLLLALMDIFPADPQSPWSIERAQSLRSTCLYCGRSLIDPDGCDRRDVNGAFMHMGRSATLPRFERLFDR